MTGFLKELRRRNVFRVGVAYLVVAWLVIQIVSNLVAFLDVPDWIGGGILILLIAGFPVSLIIAWAFELTPDGIKLSANADASQEALQTTRSAVSRKWDFMIIAALVVALGFAVWTRDSTLPDEPAASPASLATEAAPPSIAVLPFLNLSSDAEQEYFSDGLAEELLNKLAKIEGLRVAARTSSFTFKESHEDAPAIAARLGVANVLEGSVRKAGNQLRITAQLIEGEGGTHLWSETYDRELDDVFAIQEEIAEAVATKLRITLGVADRERFKTGTDNVEAYDHYLAGIGLLNELGQGATERGIEQMRLATEIDPGYADAWAVLAVAYIQNAYMVSGDFETAQTLAEETARRALQLNANLAPAHTALAHVHFLRREWVRAEQEFVNALAIPSDFVVSWDYAEFLEATGYLEEALEYRKEARLAMPLNVAPAVDLATIYYVLGDDGRATAELDRAEDLIGNQDLILGVRTNLAMSRRDTDFLRDALATASAVRPDNAVIEALIQCLDAPETARDRLRELQPALAQPPSQVLVTWSAYFGEAEIAAELVQALASRSPLLVQPVWYPVMHDARQTPAFKNMMRDLGLVDFWRTRGWPMLCRPVGEDDFVCD